MKAIGLMSGTSADGVDAALVEIDESDLSLLGYVEVPFSKDVRREILSLCEDGRVDAICLWMPRLESGLQRLHCAYARRPMSALEKSM